MLGTKTGWTDDWQLLDTPETRRLDLQCKVTATVQAVFLAAYCGQLVTLLVRTHGLWAILLAVPALALTFGSGSPRFNPATGLVTVALGLLLRSTSLTATAAALVLLDSYSDFLMPRLFAAGRGGKLPSRREARRQRVSGLRELRTQWRSRFLSRLTDGFE